LLWNHNDSIAELSNFIESRRITEADRLENCYLQKKKTINSIYFVALIKVRGEEEEGCREYGYLMAPSKVPARNISPSPMS
jgi:hypothetical protein